MAFWSGIFVKILNMSVTASIAIVFVLAARLMLRRAPKLFSYLLWGIVLFRLLIPVSLSSPFSVLNLVSGSATHRGEMEYFSAGRIFGETPLPEEAGELTLLHEEESTGLPVEEPTGLFAEGHPGLLAGDPATGGGPSVAGGSLPVVGGDLSATGDRMSVAEGGSFSAGGDLSAVGGSLPATEDRLSDTEERVENAKIFWWSSVWLFGVLTLAVYSMCSILRLHRRVGCSMRLEGNVYLADDIPSPFVMGLLRPRIYLPSALEGREREYILLHERCHIRRLDHVIKPLAFLALCLHWFNPLVWLAFVLAGKDMEMSCDEAVMGKLQSDVRAEYAASLLHLATGRRIIAGAPLAFGEGDPKSRIKNVMSYRRPALWIGLAAAVVCVAVAACLMSNPRADQETLDGTRLDVDDAGIPTCFSTVLYSIEDSPVEYMCKGYYVSDRFFAQNEGKPKIAHEEISEEIPEEAIYKAIMEHNSGPYGDESDFECCSFVQLAELSATPVQGSTEHVLTYYGWALYGSYRFEDGGIVDAGGSHIPVALTFRLDGDGYTLEEYWEPRSGSYYVPDVRGKFPTFAAEDGIDSQKYVRQQVRECYAQAVEYGHLDTDTVVERLLNAICLEGPLESSNPQDYIDAHFREYLEMLNYGRYTVEYCLDRFEQGGGNGLEGHIMARVCEELLGIRDRIPVRADEAATGQEWYEALKAHGGNILEAYAGTE